MARSNHYEEVTVLQDTPLAASQVWQIDDPAGTPVFVDLTTEFNSAATGDVDPWPAAEAIGDQLAIGFTRPFIGLNIDVGTAGVGGTLLWRFWDGTAWVTVSNLTDDTTGFTVLGVNNVLWGMPLTWATRSLNGSAALYYIVAEVATTYATNPVLDQGSVPGFDATQQVNFGFTATEVLLTKSVGAGEVFISFDGATDHGRMAGGAPVTTDYERTRGRSGVWLRSAAGGETVTVRAWS